MQGVGKPSLKVSENRRTIKIDSQKEGIKIHTGHIVLSELNQDYLPETKSWRLNERHYGALQGLNKQETREKYGDEQVLLWRRSYDVMPPLLSEEEAAKQAQDPRYKHLQVKDGKNVLVVAHGNSLRSLVKYLLNLSEDEILKFEIPTGTPLVFDLDENLQVKEYHFEK